MSEIQSKKQKIKELESQNEKLHKVIDEIKELQFKTQCDSCMNIIVRRYDRFEELKAILSEAEK